MQTDGFTIVGNVIDNIIARSQVQNGILTVGYGGAYGSGSPTGIISGNMITHLAIPTAIGINITGGAPSASGILYAGLNKFVDVTTPTYP